MTHDLRRKMIAVAAFACLASSAAAAPPSVQLTLQDHKFTPDHVQVPAGARFKILVTNLDTTPDEFESPDLRVEKIVVPGQTITVFAGPLAPGTYAFYDDYHPETAHGVAEAK
ncbi:MAG: cupredoxin domain-containing protein [Acidocella sp.]|nr:cupredoxin domain-containing protein [Acidocella sp.]